MGDAPETATVLRGGNWREGSERLVMTWGPLSNVYKRHFYKLDHPYGSSERR